MKLGKKLNLEAADTIFATANTPLFLVRKLRADSSVTTIAASNSSEDIFRGMRAVLKIKATDFRSSVMPYVLLVALSLKPDNTYLMKSVGLPAPHHPWFRYCADYLLSNFQATSVRRLAPTGKTMVTRTTKRGNRTNAIVINGV